MNEQSSKILRAFFRENGFKNERNLIDNGLLNISNLKLLTNKKSINNNYINQKFFFENFFMKESENFFDGIVILLDLYNLTLHCKDSYFFKILPFIRKESGKPLPLGRGYSEVLFYRYIKSKLCITCFFLLF